MTSQVSVNYVARFKRRSTADLEVPIMVSPQVLTQAMLSERPGEKLSAEALAQRRTARIAVLGLVHIELRKPEYAPHDPPQVIGWDDFKLVHPRL